MPPTLKRWAWPLLLVVLVITLGVGTFAGSGSKPLTQQQRVDHLAAQIRCPTCQGLSVQQSESPLAASAKQEIISEVAAGRTDTQIKDYFVGVYGDTALMTPKKAGFAWTAWLVPAAVAVLLVVGVVQAVRKWRRANVPQRPSDQDRRRVDLALGKQ